MSEIFVHEIRVGWGHCDPAQIAYTGHLEGAIPLLSDLSVCGYPDICEGEIDAKCYR